MILISTDRTPVVERLTGPFQGATITLRRLPSPELQAARAAALALVRDHAKLVALVDRHDVWPRDKVTGRRRKVDDFTKDPLVMMGLGEWIGAVECGLRSIEAWTGFADVAGAPAPVTREVLEVLFLSEPFMDQVLPLMDRAAQLLVIEGNGSRGSPTGSMAKPRNRTRATATTAESVRAPAPTASPAPADGSVPKSSTRPGRRKAPRSGAS